MRIVENLDPAPLVTGKESVVGRGSGRSERKGTNKQMHYDDNM